VRPAAWLLYDLRDKPPFSASPLATQGKSVSRPRCTLRSTVPSARRTSTEVSIIEARIHVKRSRSIEILFALERGHASGLRYAIIYCSESLLHGRPIALSALSATAATNISAPQVRRSLASAVGGRSNLWAGNCHWRWHASGRNLTLGTHSRDPRGVDNGSSPPVCGSLALV
jgi:hypothetical protein